MELVEILNKQNEYTGVIKERKKLDEGEYRNLVHVWIINDKNEFLLQKRSMNKKHFPGKWSVTSGCVQAEETFIDACIRECKEELSIDINKEEIEYLMSFKKEPVIVQVFIVYKNVSNFVYQEEEVEEARFFSKDELNEMILNDEASGSIKYYDFLEKVIEKIVE